MAIYTPNNLKIRLDENKLYPVIFPLKIAGKYDDILLDVELWEKLPDSLSTIVAISTAFLTHSWQNTLLYALIAYFVGLLLQELMYSDILRCIFPMFLGSWLIALPLTIIVCFLLVANGIWTNAIVLGLIFLGNFLNLTSVILFFWTPISIFFIKLTGMGSVERAFISICNKRARKIGVTLNWGLYENTSEEC